MIVIFILLGLFSWLQLTSALGAIGVNVAFIYTVRICGDRFGLDSRRGDRRCRWVAGHP